jgi:hypothetical protein
MLERAVFPERCVLFGDLKGFILKAFVLDGQRFAKPDSGPVHNPDKQSPRFPHLIRESIGKLFQLRVSRKIRIDSCGDRRSTNVNKVDRAFALL